MSWLLEALWTQATPPGTYSRDGSHRATYAHIETFPVLDDAERCRAELRQRYPDAHVTIEATRIDGRPERHHPRQPKPDAAIRHARDQIGPPR